MQRVARIAMFVFGYALGAIGAIGILAVFQPAAPGRPPDTARERGSPHGPSDVDLSDEEDRMNNSYLPGPLNLFPDDPSLDTARRLRLPVAATIVGLVLVIAAAKARPSTPRRTREA